MVIWGRSNSVNVQKVLWCCEEMGLQYERIDAGGAFGVVKTSHYLSLNPNALVPTIEDDGLVLWESNAIVRYLAAKHAAGSLWPDDLKVRAEADRPIPAGPYTLSAARLVNHTVLVATAGVTRFTDARRSADLLREAGATVGASILVSKPRRGRGRHP